ncbi:hypothetical protein EC9_43220 [Rosistilla ulvae]|uniref:Uncharacterized protein n=1 Tax=Rosistilla ulvae TaxID=1930277 RepID=A0A517M5H1_9BACT|nr:hypothetical protein EC9_43220 [Rosistilla ulvae]
MGQPNFEQAQAFFGESRDCGWQAFYGCPLSAGWGAIPATFAAVLSPVVKQVTLQHALTSYTDLASAETYKWPLSSMVPGILQRFDLPDCYRFLESKQLKQIDPWGPNFNEPHDEPS